MKRIVTFFVLMASLAANADAPPQLGPLPRDPDGKVSYLNEVDAVQYCSDLGTRLPTIRELALYAQSLGAKGIRETAHVGVASTDSAVQAEIAQMKGDHYEAIYTLNSSKEMTVDFYYSYAGFKVPTGDLGYFWLYSSSVYVINPKMNYTLSTFQGDFGYDDTTVIWDDDSFRCILKP